MEVSTQIQLATVEVLPNFQNSDARQGDIIIGLGQREKQTDSPGCILNYKAVDSKSRSVSEFVSTASNDLWEAWSSRVSPALISRIVIEDLSFDTCFSLAIFLARINGAKKESKEDIWVDYVSNWEQGRYMDIGRSPSESVACLVSLLGHSYLHAEDSKPGLIACCEFIWKLYQQFDSPYAIKYDASNLNYRRAYGRFAYEQVQYELIIQNSPRFQLLVPVQNGKEKVLTDVILLEEQAPSSIVKVLLRTSQEHSWTRRGFGMMAVHRPSELGTGNDVTISVDPDTFLTLKDLWVGLEKLEEVEWDGKRPAKNPRMLSSHERFSIPASDQPWYDGGDLTLIGAPKKVVVDGQLEPGSKLDWNEHILPLLWSLYSPIPGSAVPEPKTPHASGKALRIVRWNGKAPEVPENPTLLAWLASLSMQDDLKYPKDLPLPSSFEVIRLAGGMALVHRNGVTLFNDWSSTQLEINVLCEHPIMTFNDRLEDYETLLNGKALEAIGDVHNELIKLPRFSPKLYKKWREEINIEKAKLLGKVDLKMKVETYDQTQLGQVMEKLWGVNDSRREAQEILSNYEKTAQEMMAFKREKDSHLISSIVAGLGLALFVKEVIEPFQNKATMNSYEWQIELFKKGTNLVTLESIANSISLWELGAMIVFIISFFAGAILFYTRGGKLSPTHE